MSWNSLGVGEVMLLDALASTASNFSFAAPTTSESPLKLPSTAGVRWGRMEGNTVLYLSCRHICLTPSFSFCFLRPFFFFKEFCF